MDYYNYNNELYHFGIKGMKWGVRRYQNKDGTLTDAGKKRETRKQERETRKHEKILKSDDPAYIYKHRKELNDEEFDRVYNRAHKANELKKMAKGDNSVAKEIAISTGKEAAKIALYASLVVGTTLFLTKTKTGKRLVESGKKAATDAISNIAKNTAKTTTDAAKDVAKTAKTAVKTAAEKVAEQGEKMANEARANARKNFAEGVRNGRRPHVALNRYGEAVDELVGVKRRKKPTRR